MNWPSEKLLSVVVKVSIILVFIGCAQNREKPEEAQPTVSSEMQADPNGAASDSNENSLEEKWGIKVETTRLSAGGYMVDFRYRVLDPNKAAPILDRSVKPYLIDQASGAVFAVPSPPKVGQLRSGKNIKEGKIYFIFFANPGQYVKSGNKVTVVIGNCKINDVVVR